MTDTAKMSSCLKFMDLFITYLESKIVIVLVKADDVHSVQVIRKGEVSCCWTCTPCKENEFVFDEYTCRACDLGSWPNDDLTGLSLCLCFIIGAQLYCNMARNCF